MYNIVVLYSLIKSSYECLFNRLFCCKKYNSIWYNIKSLGSATSFLLFFTHKFRCINLHHIFSFYFNVKQLNIL